MCNAVEKAFLIEWSFFRAAMFKPVCQQEPVRNHPKDLQLAQHECKQKRLNSELSRLGVVLQNQNMTLDMVYGSFGWLVTSKFRTLKDRYFFVPGSWRRRIYDSILAAVKRRFRNSRGLPNSSNLI